VSTWSATGDVTARLPYRTIGSATEPSTTDVQVWLNEAEAFLTGTLQSAGLPTTYSEGSVGQLMLQAWASDYAEGRVRVAWASAGGDGNNDDGREEINRFFEILDRIRKNPVAFGAELATGDVADAVQQVRSHVTDTADKSISAGDFDPTITSTELF